MLTAEVTTQRITGNEQWKLRVTFLNQDGRIVATHGQLCDSREQAEAQADQCRAALDTLGISQPVAV